MKILALIHSLEEAYNRFGDIDVFVQENTYSARSLSNISKVEYDSDEFMIFYGENDKGLMD